MNVLWVDVHQRVYPRARPRLDVPPLCPLVCGSRRPGGQALTGAPFWSPSGHEVLVLCALPALHRGRPSLAAQHQIQEVWRAPADSRGSSVLCPWPGSWLPRCPAAIWSPRDRSAGEQTRCWPHSPCPERGRGPCTVLASPSQHGRPLTAPALRPGLCRPRFRGSGPTGGCRGSMSVPGLRLSPRPGLQGARRPCRWPGPARREQPLPQPQHRRGRGASGHDR